MFHGEIFDVNHREGFLRTDTRLLLTTIRAFLNNDSMSRNAFPLYLVEIQVPSHVRVEYGVSRLGETEEKVDEVRQIQRMTG